MKRIDGIFTPVPTPFAASGDVDGAALRRNIARWMATPLDGLVILGSNGEAAQLEDDEADGVLAIAREGVPAHKTLIAGTGRESTRATIAATRRAAAAGADAVLVRTPGFFKAQMTSDVLVRHYTAVADASPVPVLLYNVTMFTGVTLMPDAVERLARHANIIGMKESGRDPGLIGEFIARTPESFVVLAGSASTLFLSLCAGCHGAVLALAAIVPEACVRLRELVHAGQLEEARRLQRDLMPVARSVGTAYGVAGLKAALDLLGFDGGPPRPPLQPVPPRVVEQVRSELEAIGALTAVRA